MPLLRRLVAPLTSEVTYRRYVHLVLGAAVVLPYLSLGWLFIVSANAGGLDPVALVLLLVVAGVSAVVILLFPAVHELAATAARTLLDADIPDRDPVRSRDWGARLRGAWWLLINMTIGILTTLLILIVIPMAVGFLIAPWRDFKPLPTGWMAAWAPLVGLTLPVALLHAGTAIGGWLGWLAPRLLGPTPEEQLAAELDAARRAAGELSERNRLARELHDSVGHALTVTTLQAGAAARVLDSDPEFVRRALDAIAEAGRTALTELDHVLGLLRDEPSNGEASDGEPGVRTRPSPQPDLADLDGLLAGARSAGVPVHVELHGDLATLPAAVSREAYRIVQESLTNALRHVGPVPVSVRVAVDADDLRLSVTNPLGRSLRRRDGHQRAGGQRNDRPGAGRGLTGMAERVRVLRGELVSGPAEDRWRIAVRLPLARTP
jgi:signal transduction histidine kinase